MCVVRYWLAPFPLLTILSCELNILMSHEFVGPSGPSLHSQRSASAEVCLVLSRLHAAEPEEPALAELDPLSVRLGRFGANIPRALLSGI